MLWQKRVFINLYDELYRASTYTQLKKDQMPMVYIHQPFSRTFFFFVFFSKILRFCKFECNSTSDRLNFMGSRKIEFFKFAVKEWAKALENIVGKGENDG